MGNLDVGAGNLMSTDLQQILTGTVDGKYIATRNNLFGGKTKKLVYKVRR